MALQLFASPVLPLAPSEYNPEHFNQLTRALNLFFSQLGSTTPIVIDQLTLLALPTSPVGLKPGTVYNDGGYLKIVLSNTIQVTTGSLSIVGKAPSLDNIAPPVVNVNLVGIAPTITVA